MSFRADLLASVKLNCADYYPGVSHSCLSYFALNGNFSTQFMLVVYVCLFLREDSHFTSYLWQPILVDLLNCERI